MFDFIFSLIFRRSFVCERSVRSRTVEPPVWGHSFVSDGWAVGVTGRVCLHLLIVERRDGLRMRLVGSEPSAGAVPGRRECDVVVRYRGGDGRFVDTSWDRMPVDEALAGMPVREFRAYRGRRHYSGWYWSATMGGHVVYESRLELARILLADKDSSVVAIAAQPFLVEAFDGEQKRRHVPDLLLGHADGAVTVVDVKAASRLDDLKVSAQFSWMSRLCEQRGFRFEVWSGTDPVLLENVRFLAGYRRPALIAVELVPLVLEVVREAGMSPCTAVDVERRLTGTAWWGRVRPVILHLLWQSRLSTDLSRRLAGDTVVRLGAAS